MKILVVKYQLLAKDIGHEWARRGHEVCLLDPKDVSPAFVAEVKRRGFDFLFGVNYTPVLSELCREVGLPYISWTIDPIEETRWPTMISNNDLVYCFRRRWVEGWSKAANGPVEYLPLAATSNRRPVASTSARSSAAKLLWVGSSCSTDWQRHPSELKRWYAENQSRVDAWVAERISTLDEQGGLCDGELDDSELEPTTSNVSPLWKVLVDDLTAFKGRTSLLSRVAPERLELWGDAYWRRFGDGYQGFAEHEDLLTQLYTGSALTLDIPRWYQTDIITMRVFDAMASGGVVLTYGNQDIEALFCPGLHLETYSTPQEFEDKANELGDDKARCRAMRRSGAAIVDRFHRIGNRLDVIEEGLRSRGWWRSADTSAVYFSGESCAASGAT